MVRDDVYQGMNAQKNARNLVERQYHSRKNREGVQVRRPQNQRSGRLAARQRPPTRRGETLETDLGQYTVEVQVKKYPQGIT